MVQILMDQQQWTRAGRLCERLVNSKARAFGQNRPDIMSSMTDLALIATRKMRFKEAIAVHLKVLDICQKMNSEEPHIILANVVNLVEKIRAYKAVYKNLYFRGKGLSGIFLPSKVRIASRNYVTQKFDLYQHRLQK